MVALLVPHLLQTLQLMARLKKDQWSILRLTPVHVSFMAETHLNFQDSLKDALSGVQERLLLVCCCGALLVLTLPLALPPSVHVKEEFEQYALGVM